MKHFNLALLGVVAAAFLGATDARAERPGDTNPYAYIARMGNITFNQAGAAFLPLSVLRGMRDGQISPILQFVVANNLMTQCTKEVLKRPPDIRDPYKVAAAKFNYGMCRIKKCFQQGMLMMILPQLSRNTSRGGGATSAERQGSLQMGQIFAQAFQRDEKCDGQGTGIDPFLLAVFLNN